MAVNKAKNLESTSYTIITGANSNQIGILRKIGKIVIITFDNKNGTITSSGVSTGLSLQDTVRSMCQYYNGSSNVHGAIELGSNGYLYILESQGWARTNASYVNGQIVAVMK